MKINILFDRNPPVYVPGEDVTGKIWIESDSSVTSKGLKFKSKGEAHVSWTESQSVTDTDADGKSTTRTETVTYSDTEKYYKNEYHLWGNGSKQTLPDMPFEFRYTLPQNIPTSFEGEHGYVRHECKVVLKSTLFDKKAKAFISVNPIYDLNKDANAKMPINDEKEKNFCCWCCASGPISYALRVGQSGYVCGQSIFINAECTNGSSRKVTCSNAALVQEVEFKAKSRTKRSETTITKLKHGEIKPASCDVWSENMNVPSIPVTQLSNCSIINSAYYLIFKMEAKCAKSLTGKYPIIIGTIPLTKNFSMVNPEVTTKPSAPLVDHEFPPINIDDRPPPYGFNIYNDCPPPSYAECITDARLDKYLDSSEDEGEEKEKRQPYKPFYPSYNFSHS